jgi:hypothetical protein
MKFATILNLAFVGIVSALPNYCRDVGGCVIPVTTIVFHGAAGAEYSLSVPLDGRVVTTGNALSISTISASINVATQCTLHAVDYTPALVEGPAGTWAVGPPQTIISIACNASTVVTNSITIEFDGADPDKGAKYTLNVPLNGVPVATNNALSISTLVSTYADLPTKCHFLIPILACPQGRGSNL